VARRLLIVHGEHLDAGGETTASWTKESSASVARPDGASSLSKRETRYKLAASVTVVCRQPRCSRMPLEVEIALLPAGAAWVSVPGVAGFYGGWIGRAVAGA
jgi:hypothetical protein